MYIKKKVKKDKSFPLTIEAEVDFLLLLTFLSKNLNCHPSTSTSCLIESGFNDFMKIA